MNDATPTESMVGYDANGIPARHTSPASRQHTDQREDTTRIILPGPNLPPQAIRQSVSQADILRSSGYVPPAVQPHYDLPHRDDLAYMAPEAVEAMLRRCNHVCRTNGCGQVVDRCGQFCEDCQGEIDAWNGREPQKPTLLRRFLSLFSRGRGRK